MKGSKLRAVYFSLVLACVTDSCLYLFVHLLLPLKFLWLGVTDMLRLAVFNTSYVHCKFKMTIIFIIENPKSVPHVSVVDVLVF